MSETYISRCPDCGSKLEATAVRYLSDVVLEPDGSIAAFRVWEGNDPDGYSWDHEATRVYCANDCGCVDGIWELPRHAVLGVVGPVHLRLSLREAGLVETALRSALAKATGEEERLAAGLIETIALARTP